MSIASIKESPTFPVLTMAIETFQMNRSPLFFVRERKKSGHAQPDKENTLFPRFSGNNLLNRGQQMGDKYKQI